MRNYLKENIARYQEMARMGVRAWAEWAYGGTDYADFSSRRFLEEILPSLRLPQDRPRVLELGTGVGPGALYLASRGFQVHAIDVIPEAIEQARRNAAGRNLPVQFEVMDATQIPRCGPCYDLIVDSYCLQGIVLDADRESVFCSVKSSLKPQGYYLVSTVVYDPSRHQRNQHVVDHCSGRVYDSYDSICLYEPETNLYYEPHDGDAHIDGEITVNGKRFYPFRRYRTREQLREEVESYGFAVLHQAGELGGNLVAVHRESGLRL